MDGRKGLKEAYAETTGSIPSTKADDVVVHDEVVGQSRPRGRSVGPGRSKAELPTRLAVAVENVRCITDRHADPGGYLAMIDAIAEATHDQAKEQADHDVGAAFGFVDAARDVDHDIGGELDTEALLEKLDVEANA